MISFAAFLSSDIPLIPSTRNLCLSSADSSSPLLTQRGRHLLLMLRLLSLLPVSPLLILQHLHLRPHLRQGGKAIGKTATDARGMRIAARMLGGFKTCTATLLIDFSSRAATLLIEISSRTVTSLIDFFSPCLIRSFLAFAPHPLFPSISPPPVAPPPPGPPAPYARCLSRVAAGGRDPP